MERTRDETSEELFSDLERLANQEPHDPFSWIIAAKHAPDIYTRNIFVQRTIDSAIRGGRMAHSKGLMATSQLLYHSSANKMIAQDMTQKYPLFSFFHRYAPVLNTWLLYD